MTDPEFAKAVDAAKLAADRRRSVVTWARWHDGQLDTICERQERRPAPSKEQGNLL